MRVVCSGASTLNLYIKHIIMTQTKALIIFLITFGIIAGLLDQFHASNGVIAVIFVIEIIFIGIMLRMKN